jgi:small subunit ribosomal protein S6
MRGYELMYILDPTLDEEATQALVGQVEEFMTKQGVQIEKTDPWGKRRLAYHIGKHWEGFYVLSQIQAETESVAEVERRLRVTDGVLRFLTVRVDEERAQIERQRERKANKDRARKQRRGESKQAPSPVAVAETSEAEPPAVAPPAVAPPAVAPPAVAPPAVEPPAVEPPAAEPPSEEQSQPAAPEAQDSATASEVAAAEEKS